MSFLPTTELTSPVDPVVGTVKKPGTFSSFADLIPAAQSGTFTAIPTGQNLSAALPQIPGFGDILGGGVGDIAGGPFTGGDTATEISQDFAAKITKTFNIGRGAGAGAGSTGISPTVLAIAGSVAAGLLLLTVFMFRR